MGYNNICNDIKQCYWNEKPQEAHALAEKLHSQIDTDDEDDLKALVDMLADSVFNYNDFEMLRIWLDRGFDINSKLAKKDCLILRAAEACVKPEIFQRLIDSGADVYSENSDGNNVLLLSAARVFYTRGSDDPSTALPIYIVENFDLERLDRADSFGITPLHHAVEKGKIRLVKALIEKGADVNVCGTAPAGGHSLWCSYDGVTPLCVACRNGAVELADILIKKGADETLTDASGRPPIFYLLQYPFRFLQGPTYNNPIFENKCQILSLFKNLNAPDANGNTALIFSMTDRDARYANIPITLKLIELGANVNAASNRGMTALHLAAKERLYDIVKALASAGADISPKNSDGKTPLHLSCDEGDDKIARYLIKKGADYTLQDNSGKSAMDIAAARGLTDVIELMI